MGVNNTNTAVQISSISDAIAVVSRSMTQQFYNY